MADQQAEQPKLETPDILQHKIFKEDTFGSLLEETFSTIRGVEKEAKEMFDHLKNKMETTNELALIMGLTVSAKDLLDTISSQADARVKALQIASNLIKTTNNNAALFSQFIGLQSSQQTQAEIIAKELAEIDPLAESYFEKNRLNNSKLINSLPAHTDDQR